MAASDTGGVKAFPIEGRLYNERDRLHGQGMTEKQRAWRKQFLKDQHLSPNEPRFVPELYKELYNPIRRAYWTPLNKIFNALEPFIGEQTARVSRVLAGKFCMIIVGVYSAAYYFKYNTNDWTRKGGWRVVTSRTSCMPIEKNYPYKRDRSVGADYATRGFKESTI